jgi:hypothetical protein
VIERYLNKIFEGLVDVIGFELFGDALNIFPILELALLGFQLG